MTTFDESVELAVRTIRTHLARPDAELTIVRDAIGRITAILDDDALDGSEWDAVAADLNERLGAFSPGVARVLLRRSDLIDDDDIFKSPDLIPLRELKNTSILDRLQSNQDWLRQPARTTSVVPLGVGFSLKGGVGRSTTFAVLAWHLARQGKRVLAVDLDLEAPGLGSILLRDLPDYGLVDWLMSSWVGEPESSLLRDCLLSSPMAADCPGVVQVLPAFGLKTRDYVSKVGRVLFPGTTADGKDIGFAERLISLLAEIENLDDRPDVVLLDARAGLHDVGAAAVTQLGAEVFMFGRDERQGWAAYRLLFEHLARAKGVEFGMPDADLRWRLKMVAAQIDKTEGAFSAWIEASYETWSALYDDQSRSDGPADTSSQNFERNESSAPHYPLPVYFDAVMRGVNLTDPEGRPPWAAVESAFGAFLEEATARLFPEKHVASVS